MSVKNTHPLFDDVTDSWEIITDALKGSEHIKNQKEKYLKKPHGMRLAELEMPGDLLYEDYLFRAQYPHWVKDSVRGGMGLFSRAKVALVVPKELEYLRDTVTADGQNVEILFLRLCRDLFVKGRGPRVVDTDGKRKFYIAAYEAENAPNWHTAVVGGRKVLTMATFKELVLDPENDEFEHNMIQHFRVYRLENGIATVEVLDSDNGVVQEKKPLKFNNRTIDFLPIVYAGTTDNDPAPDEVPLLQMALAALSYFSTSADYYQQLHEAAHQQRYIIGAEGKAPTFTGSNGLWVIENERATLGALDTDVKGMEERAKDMKRQHEIAIETGARVMDVSAAESGDARKARQEDQHATLAIIARMAAEALEQMFGYIAQLSVWGGSQNESILAKVSFTSSVDFSPKMPDPILLKELREGAIMSVNSYSTYWEYLTTGKMPDRDDYAEERALIDSGQ